MSSFYAYDFVFNDIPSQRFDLKIISLDEDGIFSGIGSSNIEILSQRVYRKSKPYYLGRLQNQILEFSLTFGTSQPISGMERDIISAWLFGRSEYKKLQILQDDLNGAYFNCFLTNPEPVYIGNVNYAFRCTVTCDSPFGYLPDRVITLGESLGTPSVPYIFTVYNNSSEDDYLYPVIRFKTQSYQSGVFEIINDTDYLRSFKFTGMTDYRPMYVDNDLQIVRTDDEPYENRMSYFNAGWIRLLPKLNTFKLKTNVEWLELRFTERVKIGG